MPCAALTAWTALHGDRPYKRSLVQGAKVLVTGTGGVSLFALLFAKASGSVVVATTGDNTKIDRVKALGASEVLNYKDVPNWGEVAGAKFGGFDHVINSVGSISLDQTIAAAAPGGETMFVEGNSSEDFGVGFNKVLLTDMLRNTYGFDGPF